MAATYSVAPFGNYTPEEIVAMANAQALGYTSERPDYTYFWNIADRNMNLAEEWQDAQIAHMTWEEQNTVKEADADRRMLYDYHKQQYEIAMAEIAANRGIASVDAQARVAAASESARAAVEAASIAAEASKYDADTRLQIAREQAAVERERTALERGRIAAEEFGRPSEWAMQTAFMRGWKPEEATKLKQGVMEAITQVPMAPQAIVGEAGPELATATPYGTTIEPLQKPSTPEGQMLAAARYRQPARMQGGGLITYLPEAGRYVRAAGPAARGRVTVPGEMTYLPEGGRWVPQRAPTRSDSRWTSSVGGPVRPLPRRTTGGDYGSLAAGVAARERPTAPYTQPNPPFGRYVSPETITYATRAPLYAEDVLEGARKSEGPWAAAAAARLPSRPAARTGGRAFLGPEGQWGIERARQIYLAGEPLPPGAAAYLTGEPSTWNPAAYGRELARQAMQRRSMAGWWGAPASTPRQQRQPAPVPAPTPEKTPTDVLFEQLQAPNQAAFQAWTGPTTLPQAGLNVQVRPPWQYNLAEWNALPYSQRAMLAGTWRALGMIAGESEAEVLALAEDAIRRSAWTGGAPTVPSYGGW